MRIVAGEQVAHVVADAGDAQQSGFLIEQMADLRSVHAVVIEQVEDDPGIEGPHRVPMTRPSRALKPMVVAMLRRRHGAHAGAVAEMGDDDLAVRAIDPR